VAGFLLWLILLVVCWPLALLALVLYPIVWLLLLPFRILGIAVGGVLELLKAILFCPPASCAAPGRRERASARVGGKVPARAAWLGLAGAIAFGASDTMIAFDRFSTPIPGARWPIMILYWLGQGGIAASAALVCRPGSGILLDR